MCCLCDVKESAALLWQQIGRRGEAAACVCVCVRGKDHSITLCLAVRYGLQCVSKTRQQNHSQSLTFSIHFASVQR